MYMSISMQTPENNYKDVSYVYLKLKFVKSDFNDDINCITTEDRTWTH